MGTSTHTTDGPCDDAGYGCVTDTQAAAPTPAVACTLAAGDLPARLSAWRDVVGHVAGREAVDGGIRLQLDPATPLAGVAELMRAEQACCAFFYFCLTVDSRGAALEVRAPAEGMAMVDALFGGNLSG